MAAENKNGFEVAARVVSCRQHNVTMLTAGNLMAATYSKMGVFNYANS